MAKYHVNRETGKVGICEARKGRCPFGSPEEHFPTEELALKAYESLMSPHAVVSHRRSSLDPSIFVSVMSSNNDVLTERFASELPGELEPGNYFISYWDHDREKDCFAKLTVEEDGTVAVQNLTAFKKFSSPSTQRTQNAVSKLQGQLAELQKESLPHEADGTYNPIVLGELTQEIQRTLYKNDWKTAEGATQGRQVFEDLEWALDHDLALAKKENNSQEIVALSKAKNTVSAFLNEITVRG